MGLDIIALSNMEYVGSHVGDDYCNDPGHEEIADSDGYPRTEDVKPGCYTRTGRTEGHGFRAGSYSWYNRWRSHLACAIHGVGLSTIWENPESYRRKPFIELINFSDCEGCIGPEACATLARDFANHFEHVQKYVNEHGSNACSCREVDLFGRNYFAGPIENDWFLDKYRDWQKAFELGAQSGLVLFC